MSTPRPASGKQPLLERLAHVIVRRRRAVIGLWVVLTLFGAFSASQVSKRWFESFSIPGYSSYEANQRTLKAFGTGEQSPMVAVFHSSGDITKQAGIQTGGCGGRQGQPGIARLLVLVDGQPRLRLEGRAHDLRRDLRGRHSRLQLDDAHQGSARADEGGHAPRRPGEPDRARPDLRGFVWRRPGAERADGGADRRPRLPRDPVLRLRHAAGSADPARDRRGVDPEHLHARVAADLRHQRLDHRPVPDRARRPRRRDRLRTADDLPLP